ncbi:MAG: rRNA pseudouridine synthase [Clostridia bacterium]|nr:rRNA pseudouridine synthase [Clostridia bacterium]
MAELMRLQKYMALCGVASRRAAENLITAGCVMVNNHTVTELGTKVNPDKDRVTVNGKAIFPPQKNVYIMLNKPRGYVTTAKDNFDRKTVLDLIPSHLGRLFPVGRLDYDSEGLLLLTNDGDFTYRLTHPRHEVTKSYLVLVSGVPSEQALSALRNGVVIDGRKTMPAKAELKRSESEKSVLLITILEGRNRQVRKMCAAVGHEVLRLRRVAEGPLSLGDLKSGEWRHLTEKEVLRLKG